MCYIHFDVNMRVNLTISKCDYPPQISSKVGIGFSKQMSFNLTKTKESKVFVLNSIIRVSVCYKFHEKIYFFPFFFFEIFRNEMINFILLFFN